jgi:hypothetical protein
LIRCPFFNFKAFIKIWSSEIILLIKSKRIILDRPMLTPKRILMMKSKSQELKLNNSLKETFRNTKKTKILRNSNLLKIRKNTMSQFPKNLNSSKNYQKKLKKKDPFQRQRRSNRRKKIYLNLNKYNIMKMKKTIKLLLKFAYKRSIYILDMLETKQL